MFIEIKYHVFHHSLAILIIIIIHRIFNAHLRIDTRLESQQSLMNGCTAEGKRWWKGLALLIARPIEEDITCFRVFPSVCCAIQTNVKHFHNSQQSFHFPIFFCLRIFE